MTMQSQHTNHPRARWWEDYLDDRWVLFGLETIKPAENEAVADYLIEHLNLMPGTLVFDQCCGIGRISIILAERNIDVIGVDISQPYIDRANQRSAEHGMDGASEKGHCTFHADDAVS